MHGQNMIARLQAASHDPAVTLFVMRVAFWAGSKVARVKDGHRWVANSVDDWATEVGFHRSHMRKVLARAKDAHMVETAMMQRGQQRIMHTRLTPRSVAIIAGEKAPLGASPEPHTGPDPSPAWGLPYIQGEIQGGDQEDISELALATPSGKPQELPGEEKGMIKVKSVLDMVDAVKAQKTHHKSDSVKALEFIWKKHVSETTGAMIILKEKELGQLKMFAKLCPSGKAVAVLNFVLDDWVYFVKQTQSLAGLKNVPSAPHIGFLLQNASTAATLWAQPTFVAPKKQEASKVRSVAKLVRLISQAKPKEAFPQSIEDILAPPPAEEA